MKTIVIGGRNTLAAVLATCFLPAGAQAATVYFNNFQGSVGNEWSATTVSSAPNPDYNNTRKFLGEFGAESVTLTLDSLPAHTAATVEFSLFLIRSWDGEDDNNSFPDSALGPDHWTFKADGGLLFDETFSNGNPKGQSFTGPGTPENCAGHADPAGPAYAAMSGSAECYSLGYWFNDIPNGTNEAMDSVYNLAFNFSHSGNSLVLDFGAYGLQSLADESWGLDNVKVSVTPVPLPGALSLLMGGLGVLGAFTRSRR